MDLGNRMRPWSLEFTKKKAGGGGDDGEEGETGPFQMKTRLVRKREKMLVTPKWKVGTVWPHFQGLFLLERLNRGHFSFSVSLSLSLSLSLPVSIKTKLPARSRLQDTKEIKPRRRKRK